MSFQNKHIQTVKDYARKFYQEFSTMVSANAKGKFLPLPTIAREDVCCHQINNDDVKLRTTLYFIDGTNCGDLGFYIRFEVNANGVQYGLELFSESDSPFDFSSRINNEENQIKAAAKHLCDYINSKF